MAKCGSVHQCELAALTASLVERCPWKTQEAFAPLRLAAACSNSQLAVRCDVVALVILRRRVERRAASRLGRRRGVVILLLLRVLDHLLQLNVHLPWEVVCIGHRLGGGHQHFTTRCVLDAQRGGAFLGASVTTALRK